MTDVFTQFQADSGNFHTYMTGSETDTVPTASGPVPSLAGLNAAVQARGGTLNVSNVAAVRNLTGLTDGTAIQTLGANTPGDGGGGLWRVDLSDTTTVDNTGTVLVTTDGARIKRSYDGPVWIEWWGADNTATVPADSALSGALLVSSWVRGGPGTFLFNYTVNFASKNGFNVGFAGRDKTALVFNNPGSVGLDFSDCNHGYWEQCTLFAQTVDTKIMQLRENGAGSVNCHFNNIRFVGNNGNGQPAGTDTSCIAVEGVEATVGLSNYFHKFICCNFTGFYSAFSAGYNANAWILSDIEIERTWYPFSGAPTEWVANNLWWHYTSGTSTQYATFMNIDGVVTQGSQRQAQYNHFSNVIAEPGQTNTQMWNFGANANSNFISGGWQVAQFGTDSGANNVKLALSGGSREMDATAFYFKTGQTKFNNYTMNTADEGTLDFFSNATGTAAQSGTGQQKLRVWGAYSQTRGMEVYQAISGDGTLNQTGAGGLSFAQSGTKMAQLDTAAPAASQSAMLLMVNDGSVTSLRRVNVGAADSGGAGQRLLTVAN